LSDLEYEALLRAQREQAVRDVIDSSRDDVPPPGGKERLLAKLDLSSARAGSHRSALWRAREGASVYLVGLALVGVAGVAFVSRRAEAPRPAPVTSEAPPRSEAVVPATALEVAEPPRMAAPLAPETPSLDAPPSEPSTAEPPAPSTRRSQTNLGPVASTPRSDVASAANAPQSRARSESTLGREVARMAAARSALAAGEAARTLAILDSYESEFPAGTFSVEVSVLRVEALARSGRMDEARRLGERFLKEHPHGLFARRVASTLGTLNSPEPASVP